MIFIDWFPHGLGFGWGERVQSEEHRIQKEQHYEERNKELASQMEHLMTHKLEGER